MNWQEEVIKLIEEYYQSLGVKYKPKKRDIGTYLADYLNLEVNYLLFSAFSE